MTLVEAVVALLVIGLFAGSMLSLLRLNRRNALENAYRLEAYRIAQTIAEHAMSVAFPTDFRPAGVTAVNPAMISTQAGTATAWTWVNPEPSSTRLSTVGSRLAQFIYTPGDSPVMFTKTVDLGPTTGTATTLNITIDWRFAQRNYRIILPVVRGS
jgi:type II secretory pathway pseudopilin PulG